MNFENFQVLPTSEKYKKSNEESKLENVKTLEMQECQSFISKEENSCTFGNLRKLENCREKEETAKCVNEKTNIIASKAETVGSHQPCIRNQIQLDNKLAEKNDNDESKNEKIKRKKGVWVRIIYIMDCIVSAIIIGPMVVAHWRGIWVLMDFHENIFSGWLCFAAGLSLHLLFAVLKHSLHRLLAADVQARGPAGRLACRLVRTLYTYAFSLACNCHWRGAWILLNDLFAAQPGVIACFTLAILGDLIALRCVRNLLAPPFLVTLDSPEFVFQFSTRYKAQ